MILNNIYIISGFGGILDIRKSKNLVCTLIITLVELVGEGRLSPPNELWTVLVQFGQFEHNVAVCFVAV